MSDLAKQRVDQGHKAASKPKFDGANGSTSKHEDDLVDGFARNIFLDNVKLTFWMAQVHCEQNIS